MKFLDRFILVIFSIIMFVLSVITASVIFGWIELENLMPYLESALSTEPTSNIILVVSIGFILLALKAIFFGGKDERATKDGILMENDNGRLLISKDTLENLVVNIVNAVSYTHLVDDKINICNSDTQKNYECIIQNIEENKIICKIISETKSMSESSLNITIFQGLPKSDKMELIIQKATELGVKTIVPVITKRTVIKLKDKDKQNKVDRWRKIAEVAAKQSGRDIIPTKMCIRDR